MAKQRGLLARGTGLWLVAFWVAGCASGTSGGCTALGPIPGGRFVGEKTSNAVNVRISGDGIGYLNTQWQTLLEVFAPGRKLDVPVPCTVTNVPVGGDVAIADQGSAGCSDESCGQMDGTCDAKDQPVNVPVNITSFSLQPTSPDKLTGTVGIRITTPKIYVDTVSRNHGACVYAGAVKCSLDYDTTRSNPSSQELSAKITFEIDQDWDQLLSFKLDVEGTEVCGATSTTPAPPQCLDPDDLDFTNEAAFWSGDCGVYCSVASWDFVKTFILEQISPTIQSQLQEALADQSCELCGSGYPSCPSAQSSGHTSYCEITSGQEGKCMDAQTGKCVPRFPGFEGRVAAGEILADFGAPASAKLDTSVAAGSTAVVDTGVSLGTRAGLTRVERADCVPALTRTGSTLSVPAPEFSAGATGTAAGYHVGVGISEEFINQTFFEAHQAGAMCTQLTSATVGVLNTGLVKAFLPSLGKLATRDGKDAPMMAVMRPRKMPTVAVGEGTFDPATKKPIKPLLTLSIPELAIDLYVRLDDRFVRLFTLTADVKLPVSLIFSGCAGVTPAIGDLKELVTNARVDNSELLAEDPAVLVNLIPALVGLAEPVIATALEPLALPEFSGFKLNVQQARGLNLKAAGTDAYHHLGIYAKLVAPGTQCVSGGPAVIASLLGVDTPPLELLRRPGNTAYPVVAVQAQSAPGAEVSWRVDDGLWSNFEPLPADGGLRVSHPVLLLQGRHVVSVRARMPERPTGVSAATNVVAVVDLAPPELTLRADRVVGRLDVLANDTVSPEAALQWAYKVGAGTFSAFGEKRIIDLAAVEAAGGVAVHVRDEAGHVAVATWKPPVVALRPDGAGTGEAGAAAGCSAAGATPSLLALALVLGALRRKKTTVS
jgi:hypothetical protein